MSEGFLRLTVKFILPYLEQFLRLSSHLSLQSLKLLIQSLIMSQLEFRHRFFVSLIKKLYSLLVMAVSI